MDVSINKEGGSNVYTDMYSKPTNTHQYLDFKSCHPRHVKEAIPYGQALRLRRICSSDNIVDERIKELKRNLSKRGFKKDHYHKYGTFCARAIKSGYSVDN